MKTRFFLGMGLKTLFIHPIRLFAVLVMGCISLGLLGASFTAANFDEKRARKESLYAYEEIYVVSANGGISETDYTALAQKTSAAAKMAESGGVLTNLGYFLSPNGGELTANTMTQEPPFLACTNKTFLQARGMELVGRLPEAENEIVLPVCLYNAFHAFGYYDNIASPVQIQWEGGSFEYEYDPAYIIDVPDMQTFVNGSFRLSLSVGGEELAATIVGVICYECPCDHAQNNVCTTANGYDALYLSEELFSSYTAIQYATIAKGNSYAADEELLSFVEESETLRFVSDILSAIESNAETLQTLKRVFCYVGIGLTAFCCGLIYQFFSFSLESRLGEIGILRALGASKKDIYCIFLTESALLALLQGVLGALLSCLLIPVVNSKLTAIGLKVVFMRFTPLAVLLVFGVSLIACFLSSFLPIRRTANLSPAEAIARNEI